MGLSVIRLHGDDGDASLLYVFLNLVFSSSTAAAAKLCKAAHIRSLLPSITHQIPLWQRRTHGGNPNPDL